jgi:aconitate hydratase
MSSIDSTPEFVGKVYDSMRRNLDVVRGRLGRPLTLTEKIVFGHLEDPAGQDLERESYVQLRPDRVAHQDATAQMAVLQFMLAGRETAAVPTTIHCDHLIRAHVGADADLQTALNENNEVYAFLKSVSAGYGLGFWEPGAGIIHQVLLENYAFPGGLMIGTDSHTPNAGGLGMAAIGVGGADAVDVMVGFSLEIPNPGIVGVRLTGEMSGWTAPKDIILRVAGILTTSGGTNRIVEYFGPGAEQIACTGKATITNMGAELGATTSIFPFDDRMASYLRSTEREVLANLAEANADLLTPDAEVLEDPGKYYDRVIDIDLSTLEPHIVGPHRPDLARPISEFAAEVRREGYPEELSATLIGSCTNSSYQDVVRAADVARQAAAAGLSSRTMMLVTPGSEMVRATIERDGHLGALEAIGGKVLANACGPCIGQWRRDEIADGGSVPKDNSIITSFNRNFPRRNDGNPSTQAFISSPEIAVAFALAGRLTFNPLTDEIETEGGASVKLKPPAPAADIPADGFTGRGHGYVDPPTNGGGASITIDPASKRLEALDPFDPRTVDQFKDMAVLLKARGQCTTDHISPAGPWLRFRGHLSNISENMYIGANNAFADEPGTGFNHVNGETGEQLPAIARTYKQAGINWIAVGDENYGEGSSREHAAMSPRLLGGAAVITRSFARIAESNLKKQGVLALTFDDPADYDEIQVADRVDFADLDGLAPGRPITALLKHADGSTDTITLLHTLNADQISWLWAGSALNVIRAGGAGPS